MVAPRFTQRFTPRARMRPVLMTSAAMIAEGGIAPLMDGLERGLKPDRGRLASGEQVALHPGVDGQARKTGEPRGDLDFSRREALREWRFDRESFSDRGYDQPFANRPEQLSVGGVLPDIDICRRIPRAI